MQISKIQTYKPVFTSNSTKDTFRDYELFNEETDKITNGYRIYDKYDVEPKHYTKAPIDQGFVEAYDLKIIPSNNLCSPIKIFNFEENSLEELSKRRPELYDASFLKINNKEKFSGTLFNALNRIASSTNKYSTETISEICDSAKLLKANGNQYFDDDLFNAGLTLAKKYPNDIKNIKNIMQAMVVTDEKGNQKYFRNIFDMFTDPNKRFQLDNVAEAIKRSITYRNGIAEEFSFAKALKIIAELK